MDIDTSSWICCDDRKHCADADHSLRSVHRLQELLVSHGREFCFIGGIAVQRWSEPRFTKDMDLTVLTGYGPEEKVARFLLSHFKARTHDPIEFAYNRVLLLQNEYGTGTDISRRPAARAAPLH